MRMKSIICVGECENGMARRNIRSLFSGVKLLNRIRCRHHAKRSFVQTEPLIHVARADSQTWDVLPTAYKSLRSHETNGCADGRTLKLVPTGRGFGNTQYDVDRNLF